MGGRGRDALENDSNQGSSKAMKYDDDPKSDSTSQTERNRHEKH
jgi:hypothetical protein